MSLHNFNPNNKSWKMYSNTLTSISGDDLTIKPYDGRDLLLEVSGNNEIIFKRGDISYNLDNLIGGGSGFQTGDYATYNILDITGKIIFTRKSDAKRYSDASYNNVDISGSLKVLGTISANNMSISGNIFPFINLSGSLGTTDNIWQKAYISELSGITSINGTNWPLTSGGGGTSDFSGTDISTNLIPRTPLSIDLGTPSKYWNNAYINTISANNISVSGSFIITISGTITNVNSRLSIIDTSFTNVNARLSTLDSSFANVNARLSTLDSSFTNVNARLSTLDSSVTVSASNITISGDIIPSNDNTFKLGDVSKNWSNAYIRDLSVSNISVSENIFIPTNTINSSHIINGSILGEDINDGAITSNKLANNSITNIKLQGNCVTTTNIADNTIITQHFQEKCIEARHIKDYAILASNISSGTITTTQLDAPINTILSSVSLKANSASPSFTGTITTDIIRNNNTTAVFSKIITAFIANIRALSFSNDGSIYALSTTSGTVSVYKIAENNSNAILGTNGSITNSTFGVNFGYSVAISGNGTILAIGTRAANSSTGNVLVYKYDGTSWALLGSNQSTIFIGRISGANFGETVNLSQTGTILCVTSMGVQEINVYQYNVVSNLWSQIGNIITGGGDGQAGRNVALSPDGLTVAMSGTDFNASRGRVRIFRLNSITQTSWDIIGTITGTIAGNDWNSGERVGASMSFSSDGNIIAVGAHGPATPYVVSPYTASNQGSVTVYRYSSTTFTWIQYGQTLYGVSANDGHTAGDASRGFVSINNNGTELSIVFGNSARVFSFNGNFWSAPVFIATGSIASSQHKLSGDGSRLIYNINNGELNVYESSSIGSINSLWYNSYIQDMYATYINPKRIEYTPTTGTGAQTVFSDALYRYNVFTSSGNYTPTANRPVTVLIVGGGGGGGGFLGGGGGGGGVVYLPSINVYAGQTYPVVVGGGGPSNTSGQQSSFFGAIASGGGGGGGSYPSGNGLSGGCGGGAAANHINSGQGYNTGGQSVGNSLGIHSGFIYGNSAGNLYRHRTGDPTRASGGGGAGFPSRDTDPNTAGDPTRNGEGSGGEGVINNILGPSYYWAGGGGGGCWNYQIGGWGGLGGGGGGAGVAGGGTGGGSAYNGNTGANGGSGYNATGGAGGANTGGGGGASTTGGDNVNTGGASGGSGIVIIRETLIVTTNNDTLGSPTMNWNNAYINNLNVNSINGTKHVNMLVFHSEQTTVQTHNALSIITHYLNIYVNYLTLTNNFSANASLTLKLPGTYMFDIWTWVCGAGSGDVKVEAYRNGTLVYAKRRASTVTNCGTGPSTLLWHKFLPGDVIKLYKNTNNGGRIINGFVQPNDGDIVGPVSIWYLGDI